MLEHGISLIRLTTGRSPDRPIARSRCQLKMQSKDSTGVAFRLQFRWPAAGSGLCNCRQLRQRINISTCIGRHASTYVITIYMFMYRRFVSLCCFVHFRAFLSIFICRFQFPFAVRLTERNSLNYIYKAIYIYMVTIYYSN